MSGKYFRSAETYWVWTPLTESLRGIRFTEERKAGEPIFKHYLTLCPASWIEKGYVMDASEVNGDAHNMDR